MLVGLTDEWTLNEKFLFEFITVLNRSHVNVHFFCYKDSHIDKKVKSLKSRVRVYYIHRQTSFFYQMFAFRRFFKRFRVQIVHCFESKSILSIAVAVNKYPLIPFLFTDLTCKSTFKHNFFSRVYINRVDRIITSFNELIPYIHEKYSYPVRKVEQFGVLLKKKRKTDFNKHDLREKILFEKEDWLVGAKCTRETKNIEELQYFIYTFESLKNQRVEEGKVALILFSEREWEEYPFFTELKNILAIERIENIHFVTTEDIPGYFEEIDLWVMHSLDEGIEKSSLNALVNEVPVLAPRSEMVCEFNQRNHFVIETFKFNDSRELRKKIILCLSNNKQILDKVIKYKKNYSKYRYHDENLHDLYVKLITRRYRYHA